MLIHLNKKKKNYFLFLDEAMSAVNSNILISWE